MVKTVIFDMDGVLVNSEPLHHEVSLLQFKDLNIEVTDAIFATFTGNSNKMIYQKVKGQDFQLSQNIEDLILIKNNLFITALIKRRFTFDAWCKKLIIDLYKNGIQLIVASSSEMQIINKVFERFDLDQYFTHKVSGNDLPESKPNPAIFLKAASYSKAPIEECIIIEDSTNGIKAAKAAGIFCVAYKSEEVNSQDQSLANIIIYDYKDLDFEKISRINE